MKKLLKGILVVFAVLVVFGIIASMFGGGGESEKASIETTTTPKSEKPQKKETKVYKIGDNVKVGDVIFTIHGTKNASNVGGEFGQNAQGKYLVVDITVKNNGKKAITTDTSFFKLKAGGKEYDADGTATTFANKDGNFFLAQVNPGIENRGNIVFDVPKELLDAKDLKINVQTGFFGTQQQTISLK